MTALYKELTADETRRFGAAIDQLHAEVKQEIGQADADYIRRVHRAVRYLGVIGRAALMLSFIPPFWFIGVAALALSKIIDNMELGHNVIHGQYDFIGDKHLNGKQFEWDILGTSNNWRKTHNYKHHTYTNIEGQDEDIGYGFIRVFAEQKWHPWYLLQPLYSFFFAFAFQWGVALQNLNFKPQPGTNYFKHLTRQNPEAWHKIKWQLGKDYLIFPLLAGPMFLSVLAGNMAANVIRSLWTFIIIFCGHFTEKTVLFPASAVNDNEPGQWYVRQVRGSSNITGGKLFHFLSGNLSHQIEHHLFPDIPANRYAQLAPRVKAICAEYGQTYNSGRLSVQFYQVIYAICRHAFPSRPRAI
ncbi:MAG: acyl-CoA desaturase [Reinekea forsetii]|nr:acyl-CoA desaturase [Reinekea forsetii]